MQPTCPACGETRLDGWDHCPACGRPHQPDDESCDDLDGTDDVDDE